MDGVAVIWTMAVEAVMNEMLERPRQSPMAKATRLVGGLRRNDLPILWNGMGALYNPDFIVVEHAEGSDTRGLRWIVEVKAVALDQSQRC